MLFSFEKYIIINEMKLILKSKTPKVYGTKSTSRWCQIDYFPTMMACGSLCEIDTNVESLVQLKESVETSLYYILKH
jgi:hypothetical protein